MQKTEPQPIHDWQDTLNKWQEFSLQWGAMSQEFWTTAFEKYRHHDWLKQPFDPYNIKDAWLNYCTNVMQHPEDIVSAQQDLLNRFQEKLQNSVGDDHTIFDLIKTNYDLFAEWITENIDAQSEELDDKSRKKIHFFTQQYLDAFNPNNFAFSNPDVVDEIIKSNGENLIKGFENLIEDIKRSDDILPKITMANEDAFKLGENVAVTKGSVIYRNDLMEIIQYTPTTKDVYKTPLLVIPPWINKYYILDLNEQKSLVKWAVDQGHKVFIISWKNPSKTDSKTSDIAFEDYALNGALKALDVVKDVTKTKSVHMMGYCIGGTMLSMMLSYLQKNKRLDECVSATFLTTLIDFQNAGDLKLFIDEEQIEYIESMMNDKGILDADILKATFNMLRSNDLIWSFVVNNYLLGKPPLPFDLLYWNNDSTNLPAKMHSYYLRNMYLHNRLIEKDALKIADTAIDISSVDVPCFFLSTQDDHIAPWIATYSGAKLMNNHKNTEFVLAGSGHIAGVVNPPSRNKYGYKTHSKIEDDPSIWLQNATSHEGSWWGHYHKWLTQHNDQKVTAPKSLGSKTYKPICDAPGTYVMEKA